MADRSQAAPRVDNDSTHHELDIYPELELVLSLVVATVAAAFHIDREAQTEDVEAMERAAISAMVGHYAPIAATARRVAAAAERAQQARDATVAAEELDTVAHGTAELGQAPAIAAGVLKHAVAIAVSERAAAEAAAIAAELEAVKAALSLETIAIDSCYRLALQAATSAARSAKERQQLSKLDLQA